jgi:hypothetical protein
MGYCPHRGVGRDRRLVDQTPSGPGDSQLRPDGPPGSLAASGRQDDHGDRAVLGQLAADTSEQEPGHPAPASPSHHDEVRVQLFGRLCDRGGATRAARS